MKKNNLCAKTVNDRPTVVSFDQIVYPRPCCRAFLSVIATLIALVPSFGVQGRSISECLARVETKSIIDEYERRLFVTPDEVARYVFLTNRPDDGDRSAAVYRMRRKKGSLPGAYWVTVTEAPDSLRAETRNMRVERHEAPLPAAAAHALHAVWKAVLKQTPLDEHAIPCAPTAVFSVKTPGGVRLSAVTVDLPQDSICVDLITLGESLVNYSKLPVSRQVDAATKIEKESKRLLARLLKNS
jgi:hypothetical protein